MGYEDAPATRMVATHCAICHKELVDAVSVEVGLGPVCRKRHLTELYDLDEDNEARQAANKIIHDIACDRDGAHLDQLKELFALGFPKVVTAIARTVARVKIELTDKEHPHGPGRLAVKTPYDFSALSALAGVPGRRWLKEKKHNTFPVESKVAVWQVLCNYWKGELGIGPKGPFAVRPINGSSKKKESPPQSKDTEPDWAGKCSVCGASPVMPVTGMCGPCTTGESETAGGEW